MARHALGFTTQEEERQIDRLPLTGSLPDWLRGTLVCNGPGRFEVGNDTYRHWFDGLAMLRRFCLGDGGVSYANRFLQSRDYLDGMRRGRIMAGGFATNPNRSFLGQMASLLMGSMPRNASVNVAEVDGRAVALTETPVPMVFDPDTLETHGALAWERDGVKGMLTTAHPQVDRRRGELYNYLAHFSRTSKYILYRMPLDGRRRTALVEMRVSRPAYMHSFGMTAEHLVLVEFPLVYDPLRIVLSGKPFADNLQWEPGREARFHLIRKDDGSIRSYGAGAFFAFHHVNAFEHHGDCFVDIAAYPDADIVRSLYLKRLRAGEPIPQPELRRYRLPAAGKTADYDVLSDESVELPRLNEDRAGLDYRYAYGVSSPRGVESGFTGQLVKVDTGARTSTLWREEACYPGEPVFVPCPESQSEDEGVILSLVLDAEQGSSFLLVLDAASFTERARARLPHHVPFGFHGQFFGAKKMGAG